jgi:hypothetical protein
MRILFALLAFTIITNAQQEYPQDYFRAPLDITLVAAGTFAELRSNHFHSGIDLKTQQREGLDVIASAGGFVSRIKISHFGYGKALYITHPNGYTTVYGHLQRFNEKLEAYIKKRQYEKETYEIELFPNAEELLVSPNEIVAYSGNTGGSGGPHLHFEIRDNAERPINPMLFGIDILDSSKPVITNIYAYPIGDNSHVNNSNKKQKLRLIPQQNGDYNVENLEAFGKIGFAIATIDRQDLAANKNGVYNIQTFYNGKRNFEIDFRRFSFSETKHLNRLIDYEHFKTEKQRLQKLFVEKNNTLSLYKNVEDNGFIRVEDSTASVYKVRVKDFKENDTWLTITIKGKKSDDLLLAKKKESPYYIYTNQAANLINGIVSVDFQQNTFYDDFFIDFKVKNDTLILHKDIVPAQKYFTINFDISNYKQEDIDHLYIANLRGYNDYPIYSTTKSKKNVLSTRTKKLGKYALVCDTINPVIVPVNFQNEKWLSKYRFLKIEINDKESGISNYRATVNGKWILMEYDYKTKTLVHDFNDNVILDTKNNLKLIVTDNVGNNSTFEATFYRK